MPAEYGVSETNCRTVASKKKSFYGRLDIQPLLLSNYKN